MTAKPKLNPDGTRKEIKIKKKPVSRSTKSSKKSVFSCCSSSKKKAEMKKAKTRKNPKATRGKKIKTSSSSKAKKISERRMKLEAAKRTAKEKQSSTRSDNLNSKKDTLKLVGETTPSSPIEPKPEAPELKTAREMPTQKDSTDKKKDRTKLKINDDSDREIREVKKKTKESREEPKRTKRKEIQEEKEKEEEEPEVESERTYPSQKFNISQFVKDGRRIRRWAYEDATPISMLPPYFSSLLINVDKKIKTCKTQGTRADDEERLNLDADLAKLNEVFAKF